jgi:hypothetical protein
VLLFWGQPSGLAGRDSVGDAVLELVAVDVCDPGAELVVGLLQKRC